MALTVAVLRSQLQAVNIGGLRGRLIKCTPGSSDYPTHGYSITPASVGLNEILGAVVCGTTTSDPTVRAMFVYDTGTSKLLAFGAAGGATGLTEIGNNGDLSASTVILLVLGV